MRLVCCNFEFLYEENGIFLCELKSLSNLVRILLDTHFYYVHKYNNKFIKSSRTLQFCAFQSVNSEYRGFTVLKIDLKN